jgi:hypothetical protein
MRLHAVNEGIAFLFELVAIGSLAWWGLRFAGAPGLLAPVAAMVVWGMFAAPKARFRIGLAWVLVVKALVFGSAALAIEGVGHPGLAVVFAVGALVNTALAAFDRQSLMRVTHA